MKTRTLLSAAVLAVVALGGCAVVPTAYGPVVVPAPVVIAPAYRGGGYGAYGGYGGYGGGYRGGYAVPVYPAYPAYQRPWRGQGYYRY